jgi:hypothetical protein
MGASHSLLSAYIVELDRLTRPPNQNVNPFPLKEALMLWGKRDLARGGGNLTEEDKILLDRVIPDQATVGRVFQEANSMLPFGRTIDEVRLTVMQTDKGLMFAMFVEMKLH